MNEARESQLGPDRANSARFEGAQPCSRGGIKIA